MLRASKNRNGMTRNRSYADADEPFLDGAHAQVPSVRMCTSWGRASLPGTIWRRGRCSPVIVLMIGFQVTISQYIGGR